MKSLLILAALLFSTLSWAGGPDIPWPRPDYGQPEDAPKGDALDGDTLDGDENTPKDSDSAPEARRTFSVYIEKNEKANAAQCPFIIVFEEIDSVTGDVVGESQVLSCTRESPRTGMK